MKVYFSLFILIPIISKAQVGNGDGIYFESPLQWEQLLKKATSENKFIFLDCYTSWCGPCKAMDENVYTNKELGQFMNKNFISVKILMDSPQTDDKGIQRKFNVNVFPTFLFLSPTGSIVHRSFAYKSTNDFFSLVKDAMNSDKQYYTLLENYKINSRFDLFPNLVKEARVLGENEKADSISRFYLDNYLYHLSDEEILAKDNLQFIVSCSIIINENDKAFELFNHKQKEIDSIFGSGFSGTFINYIINKEDVLFKLWKNGNPITEKPNWRDIKDVIEYKYGKPRAERFTLAGKIDWYMYKKDWRKAIGYKMTFITRYGFDSSGFGKAYNINLFAYEIVFKHTFEKRIIYKTIEWMKPIVTDNAVDAPYLDTYANLLYKVGKTDQAMVWEQKAMDIDKNNSVKNGVQQDLIYQETIQRMNKGLPTWEN